MKQRSAALFFAGLFLAVITAAQPVCGGNLATLLTGQNARALAEWYRPTAQWTGILELPSPDRRDPAGGSGCWSLMLLSRN